MLVACDWVLVKFDPAVGVTRLSDSGMMGHAKETQEEPHRSAGSGPICR